MAGGGMAPGEGFIKTMLVFAVVGGVAVVIGGGWLVWKIIYAVWSTYA